MSDLVRVRLTLSDGSIVETNRGRALAKARGWEVLDEPARDRGGATRPTTRKNGRPQKPKTSVAEAAAKKAAESADQSDDKPSSKE